MDRPPAPPGGRRADLHAHTHFSDGALSPEALVALALERGLAALAITDHDTVEALGPAREAARDAIELVPGIELSSALGGLELHLLGYFLDPAYEPLRERLVRFRAERMGGPWRSWSGCASSAPRWIRTKWWPPPVPE